MTFDISTLYAATGTAKLAGPVGYEARINELQRMSVNCRGRDSAA
jgi:hypothetical protein